MTRRVSWDLLRYENGVIDCSDAQRITHLVLNLGFFPVIFDAFQSQTASYYYSLGVTISNPHSRSCQPQTGSFAALISLFFPLIPFYYLRLGFASVFLYLRSITNLSGANATVGPSLEMEGQHWWGSSVWAVLTCFILHHVIDVFLATRADTVWSFREIEVMNTHHKCNELNLLDRARLPSRLSLMICHSLFHDPQTGLHTLEARACSPCIFTTLCWLHFLPWFLAAHGTVSSDSRYDDLSMMFVAKFSGLE